MPETLTRLQLLQQLAQPGEPMLLVVLDGVGGLPQAGKTALGHAVTPTLDDLARHSNLGLIDPVFRGITPGSGIGHLGLFGYDVLETRAERGVLEALGVCLDLSDGAVAVRGNFVTLDTEGNITDRRAGRLSNEEGARVVERLAREIDDIDGVPIELRLVREYRFALVLRDAALGGNIDDTDPQKTGVPPLPAHPRDDASRRTATLLDRFAARAREILADEPAANGVTLRGIGKKPDLPTFADLYGMTSAVVAHYPMYRGAASLVGMEIIEVDGEGEALPEKVDCVRDIWGRYDFIFLHIKKTDSSGEDGNIGQKAAIIEAFDAELPRLLELRPPVLAITGDHSTPATMRSHSWHPVPVLLHGPHMRYCPGQRFTEAECLRGALGRMRAMELLPEMLAQAGRLRKFGA